MTAYSFTGLTEGGRFDFFTELLIDYKALIKAKITIDEIENFIITKYPKALIESRVQQIVNVRQGLIYTIEKYRSKITYNFSDEICSKKFIANTVFHQDHSTYIHACNRFENNKELNEKYGAYKNEMQIQREIEIEFIKYFK